MTGPSVRLGILWFFVALAAVTAGPWPTAVLWAVTAMLAAREIIVAWWTGLARAHGQDRTAPRAVVLAAMVLGLPTPIAAALGVGFAGGILLLVAVALAVVVLASRTRVIEIGPSQASAMAVAVLLPTVPAVAVVLVTASSVWAGIFLVAAVSLYDAGYHIGAAESSSAFEGPVTGIVGVLAVTFTMAIFQATPFSTASAVVAGILLVPACPAGQWITSALLPRDATPCRATRRLDAYVVAAPLLVAVAWTIT